MLLVALVRYVHVFYEEDVDDHECGVTTLCRGVKYGIDVRDSFTCLVQESRVVCRIFSCQVLDRSIQGVSLLLARYFSRAVFAEPFEVSFSNNFARVLRDGLLNTLFSCDSDVIPELLATVIRALMTNSGASADIVDVLSILLRDDAVVSEKYVSFARHFLVGVITIAYSVLDYMDVVLIPYSINAYIYCLPVVLMMLTSGSLESNNQIVDHICCVLKIPQFSFSEFLSWIKDFGLNYF